MSGTIKCPECDASFMTLVKLHNHAVNYHYYAQLKSLLQPQFKESKGFCSECQKPSASLQSFMYHMGVKHRVVFAVKILVLFLIESLLKIIGLLLVELLF
jgi:hypothetical protein